MTLQARRNPEPAVPARTPQEPGSVRASLGAAGLALLLFVLLAVAVAEGHTAAFDLVVRDGVHGWASPAATRAMLVASRIGSALIVELLLAVAVLAALIQRWRADALVLLLSVSGALVFDLTLKDLFHRPRPEPFFVAAPHSFAFPSGHAVFSVCFYGVLAVLLAARVRSPALKALAWGCGGLLVFTIGLSRIYLGVHYPSDVLGGYLVAAVWVSLVAAADRRWHIRR